MQENILALAMGIAGAGEEEQELLAALCVAEEAAWGARLKTGVEAENCDEAFICAVAFAAAADFLASRGGGNVESFTAGEISVRTGSASGGSEQAAALRKSAEHLMAPYALVEDFCFKGVRG